MEPNGFVLMVADEADIGNRFVHVSPFSDFPVAELQNKIDALVGRNALKRCKPVIDRVLKVSIEYACVLFRLFLISVHLRNTELSFKNGQLVR